MYNEINEEKHKLANCHRSGKWKNGNNRAAMPVRN
jgi:hypothetical protein